MAQRRRTGLGPEEPQPEGLTTEELVAKFQLETERTMEAHRQSVQGLVLGLERKVAVLTDENKAQRDEVSLLRQQVEDAQHQVRNGVREVNDALRVAVDQAKQAREAAQVYEKVRETQPNFQAQLATLQTKLGEARDRIRVLDDQLGEVRGRVDRTAGVLETVKLATESNAMQLGRSGHLAFAPRPEPDLPGHVTVD